MNDLQAEHLEFYVTSTDPLGYTEDRHPLLHLDYGDPEDLEDEREFWDESDAFGDGMEDSDDELSDGLSDDSVDLLDGGRSEHADDDMDVD
jgi:hypothetical protein